GHRENDRDDRGGLLHREGCFRSDSKNDVDLELNKLSGDFVKSLGTALSPTIDDGDGATFDPAEFAQPLHKCGNPCALACRGARTKEANGRQFARLLRPRRERPRGRAPEQRDERAALHGLTPRPRMANMFARPANDSGNTVTPSSN